MLYTVTNSGLQNGRPTQIGQNTIPNIDLGATHVFTIANFTTETTPQYSDPEGDAMAYIEILTLPSDGTLKLNGVAVTLNQQIFAGQITTGNFVYEAPATGTAQGYSVNFQFDAADVGSNSLSGLNTGFMFIGVDGVENLPPDVIGDKTISVPFGDTYVYSMADFTTGTTPAYNDPEGDPPSKLKILDLPDRGTLVFNGTNVSVNQEINASEVNAGYLTWVPDLIDNLAVNTTFNFAVSDTGSGQFSS